MAAAQINTLIQHLRRAVLLEDEAGRTDGELLESFICRKDEAAFAALVRRHGPMVLSVCRRIIGNHHDAEDAFQATFLVLARKASAVRPREMVANWLHGVACRTGLKARTSNAKRHVREQQAAKMPEPEAVQQELWHDLLPLLDQELNRLPKTYRLAIVLCDLEGKSIKEATRQLGWPQGTLAGRLARGRKWLAKRLANRGVLLSTGALAAIVSQRAAAANVPTALMMNTVQAATLLAAGQALPSGTISTRVAALAEGALKTMFLSKMISASVILFAAAMLLFGSARLMFSAPKVEHPGEAEQIAGIPDERAPDTREWIIYSGRVLGPDHQPVAGAKLYMTVSWGYPHYPSPSPEYATTGADGRFSFRVPHGEFGNQSTTVAAAAAHLGVGWVELPSNGKRDDLIVQMANDDVPITGELVDLEGKPVAGATLRLLQINAADGGGLGPWLEAVRDHGALSYQLGNQYFKQFTIAIPLQVATDARGRFRLTGIGRNRLIRVQLDGPTIVSQQLCILTRPGEAIQVMDFTVQPEFHIPRRVTTYYGASFRLAVAPTKPVVGVVRDQDTKKPLAGITIRSGARTIGTGVAVAHDFVRTTTDAEGRYRLTGLPKGEGFSIVALPGDDQPYGVADKKVPDSPGLEAVTIDFELKRGIWIEGKITDKATGRPLKARVQYFALASNPNLRDYPGFGGAAFMERFARCGAYRLLGLPGPGLIAVYPPKEHYLRAPERDDDFGTVPRPPRGIRLVGLPSGAPPALAPSSPDTDPYSGAITSSNYSALARIDPPKGVGSFTRDVTLDPGWRLTGTVLGPDGKPLEGVGITYLGNGLRSMPSQLFPFERMKTAEFTVWFNPRRPRDILFQHPEKGLIGVAHPPKQNGASVTVRLEPGATVRGRLVDGNGKPRAGVGLIVFARPKNESIWSCYGPPITTDGQGRFKISTLPAGYEFNLDDNNNGQLSLGDSFRAGETKHLGDVQVKEQR